MKRIKQNAKALILVVLAILAALGEVLGLDLGLDIQHYLGLLAAGGAVWAIPNEDPDKG